MNKEKDARKEFGLLIKNARAERKMLRGRLAHLVGVDVQVIKRLEHGVKNPTRRELVRSVYVLKLPDKEKNEAYRLLRIFSPRRASRVKFHPPSSNFSGRSIR